MLQGQTGCVSFRLLHGLLDQFIPAALTAPRLETAGKRAILPGRENSQLAVAARLGVRLANGCLVRGKLLLDLRALIARCSGQVLLGILQLILIQVQLGLGDFQIVFATSICRAPGSRSQTPHLGLILFGRLLQLRHLLGKLEGFTRGREVLFAGLA